MIMKSCAFSDMVWAEIDNIVRKVFSNWCADIDPVCMLISRVIKDSRLMELIRADPLSYISDIWIIYQLLVSLCGSTLPHVTSDMKMSCECCNELIALNVHRVHFCTSRNSLLVCGERICRRCDQIFLYWDRFKVSIRGMCAYDVPADLYELVNSNTVRGEVSLEIQIPCYTADIVATGKFIGDALACGFLLSSAGKIAKTVSQFARDRLDTTLDCVGPFMVDSCPGHSHFIPPVIQLRTVRDIYFNEVLPASTDDTANAPCHGQLIGVFSLYVLYDEAVHYAIGCNLLLCQIMANFDKQHPFNW